MTQTTTEETPLFAKFLASFIMGAGLVLACDGLADCLAHKDKPLTDAEIISQTEACNHENRISEAAFNSDHQITKVWCGLPPYENKMGWR